MAPDLAAGGPGAHPLDLVADSTIVGGTLALIRAIVDHPGIEALQVDPSTSLYANGDTINGTHPSGWPQEG